MIRPVILSRPENTAVAFLILSACAGAAANRASARAVVKPRDIIRIVRWRGLERPVEPLTREPWWKKGAGERPQGYRIWLGLGFMSSRARKSSSHPALFNFPLIEPFDPSSLRALSAQRRSRARFCGPLSFRVRL